MGNNMPSMFDNLRRTFQFFTDPHGAEDRAIQVLRDYGIKAIKGVIYVDTDEDQEKHIMDAISFLEMQYDYTTEYC